MVPLDYIHLREESELEDISMETSKLKGKEKKRLTKTGQNNLKL